MSVQYSGDKITFADGSTVASGWSGFKNRIINGAMMIDQRNAGTLVAGTTGNIFAVDRFATGVFGSGTGRISAQQSSTVPTGADFTKSVVNTVTTADASPSALYGYCFQQKVEGYNVADLMWGTSNAQSVTLSFWVRSSLTGTYIVTFSNGDVNRTYSATYVINASNTWEQKTITVAGDTTGTWDSTNGNGIHLIWGLGGGSSRQAPSVNAWNTGAGGGVYAVTDASGCVDWIATNGATFYITGVQLEKGSTATSFDYRPYGTELALCQRYYGTTGLWYCWTAALPLPVFYKVTMRTTPTIAGGGAGFATSASTPEGAIIYQNTQGALTLTFTAEL
jgi:hypothetical protein